MRSSGIFPSLALMARQSADSLRWQRQRISTILSKKYLEIGNMLSKLELKMSVELTQQTSLRLYK
jgi:hypothetical protein